MEPPTSTDHPPTSHVKKKTSGPNCYVKEIKQAMKRSDLAKLSKKMERVRNRLFHTDRQVQSTFVPSQQSSGSSSNDIPHMPHQPVIVHPPYPVYPGMGSGFPQLPQLPQYPQVPQQPYIPPSYGWALNGIESSALPPPQQAFGALSLDVGVGNESAGSGFDHLAVRDEEEPDISYLRPDPQRLNEHKQAQSEKLERVKKRLLDEFTYATLLEQDEKVLREWYDQKYVHLLVDENAMTTEELEERVKSLEEKMRRLRAKTPLAGPPPRPPPPRSSSQDSSTGPWTCSRCREEHSQNEYRCRKCQLPSRRFDPSEVERCKCEYCAIYAD